MFAEEGTSGADEQPGTAPAATAAGKSKFRRPQRHAPEPDAPGGSAASLSELERGALGERASSSALAAEGGSQVRCGRAGGGEEAAGCI
jgi:hypothetical protein